MTDLEQRIRDLLDDAARSAPPPRDTEPTMRRTRRRQGAMLVGSVVAVAALAAGSLLGVRALLSGDGGGPADGPTATTTMNGVTITHPEGWVALDPDEAGLNGPNPTRDLPRLVLAVTPIDTGELLACPAMVEGTPPTFLMTIQEEPLALEGPAAGPWPVELAPLSIESGVTGSVGSVTTGCYPGWEILHAGWTSAGRTFEARVGLAPEISEEDRDALLEAFASMSFEPSHEPVSPVVLATGTADGEEWELIAQRQDGELVLSLDAETFGTGAGGFDPTSDQLHLIDHVFGEGEDGVRVVFGAVPASVVHVNALVYPDLEMVADVLDVPDAIDANMNAFVLIFDAGERVTVRAFDASEQVVASGEVGPGENEPVETPLPTLPPEVQPEHGGESWGLYLEVSPSVDDRDIELWARRMQTIGYIPSVGDLACDDGAAAELDVPTGWSRVAVYFATRADAETAAGTIEISLELGKPVGIARVTTYCLD